MKRCLNCRCGLTNETMQHHNSPLCKECYRIVRKCSGCGTLQPLDEFSGDSSYTCRSCAKRKARPGDRQCKTCGETRPAIDYKPGAKDCPDCFGKRRKCVHCQEVRTVDDFHKTASGAGLRRVCKQCVAAKRRDAWHSRPRNCRVCGQTKRQFPLNSPVCNDCYGKFIRCLDCKEVKSAEEFHHDKANPTGHQVYCKSCQSIRDHNRRSNRLTTCLNCKTFKPRQEFSYAKKVCNDCKQETTQRCGSCGKIKHLSEFGERDPRSASGWATRCKQCVREKQRRVSSRHNTRYALAKSTAKRRQHTFDIPADQYSNLIEQPCQYCNHELNETGSGLDRINPTRGYTLDNVVPCCRHCNWTKSDYFTYDEMLVIGEAIGRVKSKRLEHGKVEQQGTKSV